MLDDLVLWKILISQLQNLDAACFHFITTSFHNYISFHDVQAVVIYRTTTTIWHNFFSLRVWEFFTEIKMISQN